jgi:hypothetical protein
VLGPPGAYGLRYYGYRLKANKERAHVFNHFQSHTEPGEETQYIETVVLCDSNTLWLKGRLVLYIDCFTAPRAHVLVTVWSEEVRVLNRLVEKVG